MPYLGHRVSHQALRLTIKWTPVMGIHLPAPSPPRDRLCGLYHGKDSVQSSYMVCWHFHGRGAGGGGAVRGASFSSSWMNLMCFQAGIRSVPLLMSKVSQVLPKNFLQQSYFICYWFSPNECMRCLCDEGSCHCQKLRGNPLHSAE